MIFHMMGCKYMAELDAPRSKGIHKPRIYFLADAKGVILVDD
jgi:hypothetical protein